MTDQQYRRYATRQMRRDRRIERRALRRANRVRVGRVRRRRCRT